MRDILERTHAEQYLMSIKTMSKLSSLMYHTAQTCIITWWIIFVECLNNNSRFSEKFFKLNVWGKSWQQTLTKKEKERSGRMPQPFDMHTLLNSSILNTYEKTQINKFKDLQSKVWLSLIIDWVVNHDLTIISGTPHRHSN